MMVSYCYFFSEITRRHLQSGETTQGLGSQQTGESLIHKMQLTLTWPLHLGDHASAMSLQLDFIPTLFSCFWHLFFISHHLQTESRVRNLKFATYLKFPTCGNIDKIHELR